MVVPGSAERAGIALETHRVRARWNISAIALASNHIHKSAKEGMVYKH